LKIALDATYSVGDALSGVGLYSREILFGLAAAHPETRFDFYYRPHRFLRAGSLPPNTRRRLLAGPIAADLFHGLNQRLPRVWRGRAIATFHDLFVMTGEYSTPEFRARFTAQAREAAARADALIAVSEFTKRQVVELLNVDAARVHVVHHGLRPLRCGAGKTAREKVVLNVGAIQTRKNIGRLVEAFEALDASWRLVLAGSFGYASESIRQSIERSPARERIAVLGYIPAEELASWYARASIFAFPSLDEGFGMPLLEAMAAGVPIVTSAASALPEVAGDAALLVDPRDTDALAQALVRLSEDEELRRSLIRMGEARVRKFSWENAVRQTWAVYEQLLERSA
jgi:glycosyltransferase involved in cell wall biosynthesis